MLKFSKSLKGIIINWLAHIFLSELTVEFQIGNYISDPLKGKAWENASVDIKNGIQIHKIIDGFCDSNIHFINSKDKLKTKGLLRGVAVDIIYDYLLTKNWDKFCNISFDDFTHSFYKSTRKILRTYPLNVQHELKKITDYELLHAYSNLDDVALAFRRIDRRLSARLLERDTLNSYITPTFENINEIEKDFLEFFPIICQEIKKYTDTKRLNHWKI